MKPSMKPSTAVFEADPEGFRALNADRPPEHLVRELVQNALDEEGVTTLRVDVAYYGPYRGTTVIVTDDSPKGVADSRLLFTIWLSDKQDSPTKRGRMGRGLKELVSVADETVIRSCSCDAIAFKRHKGGRWERKTKPQAGRPEKGTEVLAFCRGWGKKAVDQIVRFLRHVRTPNTIRLVVNGEEVMTSAYTECYALSLPTIVFEAVNGERAERERIHEATVECFPPPESEKAHVYEMGIPVEECDGPVSIDVGQRVILRERRDTLTERYKRILFAKVLSARIEAGKVADAELRDNHAVIAAASFENLSWHACDKIAKVWTEGKPFAGSPEMRQLATGQHIEVVNLRGLPEAIRDIVRGYGTNVQSVLEKRRPELCPPVEKLSKAQETTKRFFEWIAKGIDRPCTVSICAGNPGARGAFDRSASTFYVYAEVTGKRFFETPASVEALRLLIHELSHWTPKADEHGSDFAHDNDTVGGEVASFLLQNAEEARRLCNG